MVYSYSSVSSTYRRTFPLQPKQKNRSERLNERGSWMCSAQFPEPTELSSTGSWLLAESDSLQQLAPVCADTAGASCELAADFKYPGTVSVTLTSCMLTFRPHLLQSKVKLTSFCPQLQHIRISLTFTRHQALRQSHPTSPATHTHTTHSSLKKYM